eukprot:7512358-Pyramimonas_sp.AAC.1
MGSRGVSVISFTTSDADSAQEGAGPGGGAPRWQSASSKESATQNPYGQHLLRDRGPSQRPAP